MYTLFGFPGFGSVIVEATLELAGLSYRLERVDPFQLGSERDHWRPRRAWFAEQCPKLHAVALACDTEPRLVPVWARNFG